MRIIAKKHLIAYGKKHPEADQSLRAWHDEALNASWRSPRDIKEQYRNASIVGNNRVVFNIKGNDHRLVVAVAYRFGAAYIKFVGTHEEYDRIDAATVEME
jgi:mRNA interferase HigB